MTTPDEENDKLLLGCISAGVKMILSFLMAFVFDLFGTKYIYIAIEKYGQGLTRHSEFAGAFAILLYSAAFMILYVLVRKE